MLQKVKNLISILFLSLFAIGMTACSSSGSLRADYDKEVDFSQYNTYNFIAGAGPDHQGYESLFTRYMIDAVTIEMEKRGYTKSDNPDLLVNFNARLQDKTQVRQTASPQPYYGYRGGFYDPWMGYGYGSETHVSQYTEGTFNIDLVDAKRKQLVWEAVGVGRVSEKDMEQLEQKIKEGVPKYFENYPFTAGSSVHVQPE